MKFFIHQYIDVKRIISYDYLYIVDTYVRAIRLPTVNEMSTAIM